VSDLSQREDDEAGNVKAVNQNYVLRGWLTTLLIRVLQAETRTKYRIANLEQQAQLLRAELDQARPAIESLKQTIHSVDEAIRRERNEIDSAATTKAARPDETETKPRQASRGRRPRARSGQRKEDQPNGPEQQD
jgi:chromosome segregation ATPase